MERLSLSTERLDRVFSLNHRSPHTLPLECSLISTFTTSLCAVHLQVEYYILVALGQTAQQADRAVLIPHLGADACKLRAGVQGLVAMMQHIAVLRHLHTEELALQVDAPSLLRPAIQCLDACPCSPRFLAIVNDMMIAHVHMQKHNTEGDVA